MRRGTRTFQAVHEERRTLREMKWNKGQTLPIISDINLLTEYLQDNIAKCIESIKNFPTYTELLKLSRLTLTLLIVFNRRRSGEVQRTLLENALKMKVGDVNDDIMVHLQPFEKKLVLS